MEPGNRSPGWPNQGVILCQVQPRSVDTQSVLVEDVVVSDNEVEVNLSLPQRIEEDSLCPGQGPVVNAFTHIKTIAKMNNFAYIIGIKVRKEYLFIKLLKIIMKYLVTLLHSEVGVSD